LYKLYQKQSKTPEYPLGARAIPDGENPFNNPCLFCFSPQAYPKHVFGVTKVGMEMARMRVKGRENAGFNIDTVPVSFLNVLNEGGGDKQIDSFVDTYLVPLVTDAQAKKIDVVKAMKNMRNVNMMSYCDGTFNIADILECLYSKMEEIGYLPDEIRQISSQICVFPFSTEMPLEQLGGVTYVDFLDINDEEIYSPNLTPEVEARTSASSIGEALTIQSDTKAMYTINGTGCHKLRQQFTREGKALPVVVSRIISNALQNSILNANSDEFHPITTQELTRGCPEIMQDAEKGIPQEELMRRLDTTLDYGGAKRLTETERLLIEQLESACDKIASLEQQATYDKAEISRQSRNIDKILGIVKEFSTELLHKRLLHETGRWQLNKKELDAIKSMPTDAQRIIQQEEQIGKLQGMLAKTLEFMGRVRDSKIGRFLFRKDLKALPENTSPER